MSGHTKGPWRIRVNSHDDQDTCDKSICGDIFVLAEMKGPQYSHQEANARLIAAAPDLLDALQWMVDNDETNEGDEPVESLGWQSWNEMNSYWIDGRNRALAAIAKATGAS